MEKLVPWKYVGYDFDDFDDFDDFGCVPGLVNIQKTIWTFHHLLIGKLTISIAMFNSYVELPKGTFASIWIHREQM